MTMFTRNEKGMDQPVGMKAPEVKDSERPVSVQESAPVRATPSAPQSTASASRDLSTSVISKALRITGQLESSEGIRIDGNVDGDVRGQTVTVGNGATVTGTVSGETVEVSGTVNGKIEARKVVLLQTARMSGDVIHEDLRIESGAYIDGHCRPEYGKAADKNVHPLNVSSAASKESEASKKTSNGAAKAGFGTL
jgi:cytoskeletal protein CcmA (bactofilin family)